MNWRFIPAWSDVDESEFGDHLWQDRNAIDSEEKLERAVAPLVVKPILIDLRDGLSASSMTVRVSPYLFSLIDWSSPVSDPIRRQFLPLASELKPDHPQSRLDSQAEVDFSPVDGVVWRYPDRALFIVNTICPVYCAFCTRSYAVGPETNDRVKVSLGSQRKRIDDALEFFRFNPKIRDVVVSGGDAFRLRASTLKKICLQLLEMPHIRQVRIATKGLSAMPMKITSDGEWMEAIKQISGYARSNFKSICVHTHINHPNEISGYTVTAMKKLHHAGVTVRNQSVLLRGVNDCAQVLTSLYRSLSDIQIQPYYQYLCDMVSGVEHLRVPLARAIEIEKDVRGQTAGFNTPTFVVDLPGGGGKRQIQSFESYDRESGISIFRSNSVAPERKFYHYDPVNIPIADGKGVVRAGVGAPTNSSLNHKDRPHECS